MIVGNHVYQILAIEAICASSCLNSLCMQFIPKVSYYIGNRIWNC